MTYILKPIKRDHKPSLRQRHSLSTKMQEIVLHYADTFTIEELKDMFNKSIETIQTFQEETE